MSRRFSGVVLLAVALALAIGGRASAFVVYVNPPVSAAWTYPNGQFVYADLNADGRTDFGFFLSIWNLQYNGGQQYSWGATNSGGFSSAPLVAGSFAGPSTILTTTSQTLGTWTWNQDPEPPYGTHYSAGMSLPEGDSFWGLRFHDAAETDHYGWIRFEGHATSTSLSISVVDYAYETDAGVPIMVGAVPAPGFIGTGELGAAIFLVRRRRRRQ
jgi:hypothetical protein